MGVNASGAYAIYPDSVALTEVLQTLEQGGIDKQSICLMLSPQHPIATIVRESSTHTFEQEANAVTAGLMGWLSEFGAVVIPKFGFFIHSRKFLHVLVDERDPIDRCGHNGTLVRLGLPEEDAEQFESQIRAGAVLLYLACPETAVSEWALELLRATGAGQTGLLAAGAVMETVA